MKSLLLFAPLALLPLIQQDPAKPGYDDTPVLPGQEWRVHDKDRPQPPRVAPGASAASPPADAVVLLGEDGTGAWQKGNGKDAEWDFADGVMTVNGTGDIRTRQEWQDFQLHVEWATPTSSAGHSQGMGNSGVYLQGRYEIQVLDSHDNISYADGSAGALYGQHPPAVNASRAPGEWQSYDILFTAPRHDADGVQQEPARVTVLHNGVMIHNHREILGPTRHRSLPPQGDYSAPGPVLLQDHGNPVRYRNIWIRPM